jgi:hypothetical protein
MNFARKHNPVVEETRVEFEIVSVGIVCAKEDGPEDLNMDESARASPKMAENLGVPLVHGS